MDRFRRRPRATGELCTGAGGVTGSLAEVLQGSLGVLGANSTVFTLHSFTPTVDGSSASSARGESKQRCDACKTVGDAGTRQPQRHAASSVGLCPWRDGLASIMAYEYDTQLQSQFCFIFYFPSPSLCSERQFGSAFSVWCIIHMHIRTVASLTTEPNHQLPAYHFHQINQSFNQSQRYSSTTTWHSLPLLPKSQDASCRAQSTPHTSQEMLTTTTPNKPPQVPHPKIEPMPQINWTQDKPITPRDLQILLPTCSKRGATGH